MKAASQLRRDRLADVVPHTLREVAEFLQRQQIACAGAPVVRYLVVDYNTNNVEVEVVSPSRVSLFCIMIGCDFARFLPVVTRP